MGIEEPKIAFREDVMAAYEERLRRYKELTKNKYCDITVSEKIDKGIRLK